MGNEPLLAIDFRPLTGDLYGFAPSGRLYVLNLTSGAASIPAGTATALTGTRFGFDFNPTVDRIRVVTDTDQNVRLHPDTGVTSGTDTNLIFAATDVNAGADPNVVGVAYTNNFAGAGATVLYDIDSNLNALLVQSNPNGGTPEHRRTVGCGYDRQRRLRYFGRDRRRLCVAHCRRHHGTVYDQSRIGRGHPGGNYRGCDYSAARKR